MKEIPKITRILDYVEQLKKKKNKRMVELVPKGLLAIGLDSDPDAHEFIHHDSENYSTVTKYLLDRVSMMRIHPLTEF